jgi:hypothetical protein
VRTGGRLRCWNPTRLPENLAHIPLSRCGRSQAGCVFVHRRVCCVVVRSQAGRVVVRSQAARVVVRSRVGCGSHRVCIVILNGLLRRRALGTYVVVHILPLHCCAQVSPRGACSKLRACSRVLFAYAKHRHKHCCCSGCARARPSRCCARASLGRTCGGTHAVVASQGLKRKHGCHAVVRRRARRICSCAQGGSSARVASRSLFHAQARASLTHKVVA